MNAEVKTKWLEKLRSNEYEQGRHTLVQEVKGKKLYCCLGVLCDILEPEGWAKGKEMGSTWFDHSGWNGCNGKGSILEKAELVGLPVVQELARMNDEPSSSFAKVADYIEKNL